MILLWAPSRQVTTYYSPVALQQRLQNQDNLRVPGIISTIFATPYFTYNGHVIRRDVDKVIRYRTSRDANTKHEDDMTIDNTQP